MTSQAVSILTIFVSLSLFPLTALAFIRSDDCQFGTCRMLSIPPTEEEKEDADRVFDKTRYILGAVYKTRVSRILDPEYYQDMPHFISRTKKLKEDIDALEAEAARLPPSLRGYLEVSVAQTRFCLSYADNSEFCDSALHSLREWVFWKKLGDDWSGYGYTTEDWSGFPLDLVDK